MTHLWEFGPIDGRPIVALHGLKGYGGRWRSVAKLLEPAGFRVLAPDMRGHGRSSFTGPWTLEQHAADVLGLPVFHDGEQVDVVGHSFGGAVAVMMAALAPRSIRRLVLLDPVIGAPADVSVRYAAAEKTPPEFDDPAAAAAARARFWPPEARDQVDAEVCEHLYQSPGGRWHWRYEPEMAVAAYYQVARPMSLPAAVPVLVLRAARGSIPAEQAERWRAEGADVVEVDCGHLIYLERPAETAAAIGGFLAAGNADVRQRRVHDGRAKVEE